MRLNVLDQPDPWYADGLSFTCTQCGNCCTGSPGYVWVSDVEVDRLAAYLETDRAEVLRRYCRKVGGRVSLKEERSPLGLYDCVFLKEIKTARREGVEEVVHTRRVCTIYAVRPLQCRTWPFWEGNLASEKGWARASNRCPGMGRGKQYTPAQIEALRDAPDWPEQPPTSGSTSSAKPASPK
ncbi:MAG: YkgJ family cysteine cluster protein [Tepidisphaeraceae bacterium]